MKNILLIGMGFYNYENAIIQKFMTLGYQVYFYRDRLNVIDKLFPSLQTKKTITYILDCQKKNILAIPNRKFDYVVVIVGRFLSPVSLDKLKSENPQAKFILYLWDDVLRVQNFRDVSGFYDEIFSFDPADSVNYGFHFLPLFYSERRDSFSETNVDFVYDIYSAMICHSDREKIALQIIQKYDSYRIHVDLLLAMRDFITRKILNGKNDNKNISYLSRFTMINEKKLYDNMLKAKAILDVQYASQIGLTMRTFDTMSVGRKLITTNTSIRYYNFYHENNVWIIDRENPEIPEEFLDFPYEKIDDEIINSYSLDNWISVLLGEKSCKYLVDGNPYNL